MDKLVEQRDKDAARACQVDLLLAGANGDKAAWRRCEEAFAAHRQAAIAATFAHIREQAGRDDVSKRLHKAANDAWTYACEDEALGSNAAMAMVVDAVVTAMLNQIEGPAT
jgi:hypothetical protein